MLISEAGAFPFLLVAQRLDRAPVGYGSFCCDVHLQLLVPGQILCETLGPHEREVITSGYMTSTSWIKVMNASRRQNCEVSRLCLRGPKSPFFTFTPFVFPSLLGPQVLAVMVFPFQPLLFNFALRKDLISLTLKILIFIILNMWPSKWAFIFNNNYFRLKGRISKCRTQVNSQVVGGGGGEVFGEFPPQGSLALCCWFTDDLKNFHWRKVFDSIILFPTKLFSWGWHGLGEGGFGHGSGRWEGNDEVCTCCLSWEIPEW